MLSTRTGQAQNKEELSCTTKWQIWLWYESVFWVRLSFLSMLYRRGGSSWVRAAPAHSTWSQRLGGCEAGMGVRSFGGSACEESSIPQRVKKISWGLWDAQHLSLTMLDSTRISFHEACEFGLTLETYRWLQRTRVEVRGSPPRAGLWAGCFGFISPPSREAEERLRLGEAGGGVRQSLSNHKACVLHFLTSFWNRCYYPHLSVEEANNQGLYVTLARAWI